MADIEFLPLKAITEGQLQALVENQVAESQTLEFKLAAVGSSDAEKKEFLKDVTALANTSGGLLVFGIAEKESVADIVVGLTLPSVDKEVLRLQSILQSSVEPRLAGVEMKEVALASGSHALLVKVPQSGRPPHRVTYAGSNRFYLRHSKGVIEPDTEGLRHVFTSGLSHERELEAWRDDRLARLSMGNRGFRIDGPGVAIVQVASLARGQPSFQIPPITQCNLDFLPPLQGSSSHRYNFDGLLIHAPSQDGTSVTGYTQLFRSWKVEMARGGFVEAPYGQLTVRPALLIAGIFEAAHRSIKGMVKYGGIGPFAVAVTISGLLGSVMRDNAYGTEIDRDMLRFPLLLVGGDVTSGQLQWELLPVWDGVWQAYGHSNCNLVRDSNGAWKGLPQNLLR